MGHENGKWRRRCVCVSESINSLLADITSYEEEGADIRLLGFRVFSGGKMFEIYKMHIHWMDELTIYISEVASDMSSTKCTTLFTFCAI